LRIADETTAILRELGIETIGQLQLLPRDDLTARFGDELLLRLDQLTGAGREIIEPHREAASLATSCALEEPTGDRAVLLHVLSQLVKQLAQQLAARDEGAVLVVCLLRCKNAEVVPLRVGLLQPSASPRQLLELIELHLESLKLADEIDRVEIRAAVVGRLGERQGELFADHWTSDPHQLAVLVNRLSSRLGDERVLRADLRTSPLPERTVVWRSAVESRVKGRGSRAKQFRIAVPEGPGSQIKESQSAIRNPHSAIPLLLYPKPQPIEVTCIEPAGPPQFIWLENRRERIADFTGPERVETLWWHGPSVRRDYYRAVMESGSHWWIFQRLQDARWFLHGKF
jgi:protein ImuB